MFPLNFILVERIAHKPIIGDKQGVLEHLAALLASGSPNLTRGRVLDQLLERERLGSTGIGKGVALPHARLAEAERPLGAFLRLANPVAFDASDNVPVDLVFGMMVPEAANNEHLQLLAKLATLFDQAPFRAELRAAGNPEDILRRILDWEAVSAGA